MAFFKYGRSSIANQLTTIANSLSASTSSEGSSSSTSGITWYQINSTSMRTSGTTFASGLYRVTATKKEQTASPLTGDIRVIFKNSGGTEIADLILLETDSGNTLERFELTFFLDESASSMEVYSPNQDIYFSIERLADQYQTSETFVLTYYDTAQNVTITEADSGWILIGAGGGSYAQGWGGANGSGGGGSGYVVIENSPTPGTYALTVGAGAANSNGGASTFAGQTANGGIVGGQGGAGGAGGSGGGTGAAQGASGGINGNGGGGTQAGAGSGQALPLWAPAQIVATTSQGGYFYGGGGGGNFGTGGQDGRGYGGGAGGKNSGGSGRSGAGGALVVGSWV